MSSNPGMSGGEEGEFHSAICLEIAQMSFRVESLSSIS